MSTQIYLEDLHRQHRSDGYDDIATWCPQVPIFVRAVLSSFRFMFASQFVTLYAFSTENWSRPAVEVSFLMKVKGMYVCFKLVRVVFDFVGSDVPHRTSPLTLLSLVAVRQLRGTGHRWYRL